MIFSSTPSKDKRWLKKSLDLIVAIAFEVGLVAFLERFIPAIAAIPPACDEPPTPVSDAEVNNEVETHFSSATKEKTIELMEDKKIRIKIIFLLSRRTFNNSFNR